jgi:hypothetical protein
MLTRWVDGTLLRSRIANAGSVQYGKVGQLQQTLRSSKWLLGQFDEISRSETYLPDSKSVSPQSTEVLP